MQRLLRSTLSIPLFWYQYELLYSVIGFPQRPSSLQPIPSREMYCRMRLGGIKLLINGWDKSINNAEIRDTEIGSQTPLQDTSLEGVQRKCPVWHHQHLPGLTCHMQRRGTTGALLCLSYYFGLLHIHKKKKVGSSKSSQPSSYTWMQQAFKIHLDSFSPFRFDSFLPLLSLPLPSREDPLYAAHT